MFSFSNFNSKVYNPLKVRLFSRNKGTKSELGPVRNRGKT